MSTSKELQDDTAAQLAVPFPPSAACRFLDLQPGNRDFCRQQAAEFHPLMGREHCEVVP